MNKEFNVKTGRKPLASTGFLLLVLILTVSQGAAMENYYSDFDSFSTGVTPPAWDQWQNTTCGASDCSEGYGMVANNYSVSSPNSMECLEKTAGTRRCFINVDPELRSTVSFNYSLNVSSSSGHADIQVFKNMSGSYKLMEDVVSRETSGTSQGYVSDFELGVYAGEDILLGAEVSGEGAGTGRAAVSIDNLNLSDGGEAQAPTDLEKTVEDEDNRDPIVAGRKINTSYSYEIESTYFPVDTAMVIDSSGSMDGVLDDVKTAAKNYTNNTLTSKGDMNAVIDFDTDAEILQSLTTSKQDVRNAIDSMSVGGSTNTSDGIKKGHEALLEGSNPISAMIFLADGNTRCWSGYCPPPGPAAQEAREDGIVIHGIMYGDGVDTAEFEAVTGSDSCTLESSENSDGDKCWYGQPGTIEEVYRKIREELEVKRSANISMVLPEPSIVESGYDSSTSYSGFTEYKRRDINLSEGNHTETMIWRPLIGLTGDQVKIAPGNNFPGPSRIRFKAGDDITLFEYPRVIERDVTYVDFNITGYSVLRTGSGVNISVNVTNEGTALSYRRNVTLSDESGNRLNRSLPRLGPGSYHEIVFDLKKTNPLVKDAESMYLHVDPLGFWDSRSRGAGESLEPDESNNKAALDYPPRLLDVEPASIEWNQSFQPNFTLKHPNPSQVTGIYNYTRNQTLNATNEPLSTSSTSSTVSLWTEKHRSNQSEIYYNFTVVANSSENSKTVIKKSYFVENPRPQVTALNPPDDSIEADFPVNLKARITDENDDFLNVSIYNERTGKLLYREKNVPSGDLVSYSWTADDTTNTLYYWTVNVTDAWGTYSTTFSFRKSTGRIYRSDLTASLNYSSIVMNGGSIRYAQVTVENNALQEKNLSISLQGVNAEFLGGQTIKYVPEFPPQSSKQFMVRLNPDKTGDGFLKVVVNNREIGLNTTRKIPVDVLPSTVQANQVPGIGLVQLLFIVLSATVLYSVRL